MTSARTRLLMLCLWFAALTAFAGEDVTPGCKLPPHTPTTLPPQLIGAWNTVEPAEGSATVRNILGMQTVHNVMLPSGKILMISGSSWRNKDLPPDFYYPNNPSPPTPKGAFNRDEDPFLNSKLAAYYQIVNNAAIYDPVENTFYRIPHPVPVSDPNAPNHFAPNDFFCTGHQHLPDGNVLFTGGTQYYFPFRTGNNSTWIFDWRKDLGIPWKDVDWRQIPDKQHDPWIFAGFMERGRWYPSILPLLDGRMMVFSGYVGFDPPRNPQMYQFEINHLIEFFDPAKFTPTNPQAAWKSVDVKKTPNGPFATRIYQTFTPTPGTTSCEPPAPTAAQCVEDNLYDAFKLYPENYLMPDGRIYLTREGDWVSLRTCDTAFMRRTKNTYWARVEGTRDAPAVRFEHGPDRAEEITSYGTSLLDPNTGLISILGGQPTSPGVLFPINSDNTTHFAGGRGSRKIETFHPSTSDPGGEKWTIDRDFLGDEPPDDRTMHYSIILPTRQVLIINGGNFDFYGPVFDPILLTPEYDGNHHFLGYRKDIMAAALEPRLYHNSAMLMPDGNIFVSGGNSARATYITRPIPPADPHRVGQPKPDLDSADTDIYFWNDGPVAKFQKGMLQTPTENWVAEIYSPPYQFIDSPPASIQSLAPVGPVPYQTRKVIGGKTFYLIHSGDRFRVSITNQPATCTGTPTLVLIKLPSATHGWENGQHFVDLPFLTTAPGQLEFVAPNAQRDAIPPGFYMMFYVDCMGKPAVAQMVRFDDQAREP